ncbi:hypothetical protein HDU83_001084 [Entophlyctis luteolus]|nr:hypothetical protein HDU83_001084 [Entophlyctis luteolus]
MFDPMLHKAPQSDEVIGPHSLKDAADQCPTIHVIMQASSTTGPVAVATDAPKSPRLTSTTSPVFSTPQISAVSILASMAVSPAQIQSITPVQSPRLLRLFACLHHEDCTKFIVPPNFKRNIELVTGSTPRRLRVDCSDIMVPTLHTQGVDTSSSVVAWRASRSLSQAATQLFSSLEMKTGKALSLPLLDSGPRRVKNDLTTSWCPHPSLTRETPSSSELIVAGSSRGLAAAHMWLAATGAKARSIARNMYARGETAESQMCAAAANMPSSLEVALRHVFFDDAPLVAEDFVAWLRRTGGNVRGFFATGGAATIL